MGAMSLEEYVNHVSKVLDSTKESAEIVSQLIHAKKALLSTKNLIPERFQNGLDDLPYTRNLLHMDPEKRFVILSLVWRQNAETPAHDHCSWGVVGNYCGEMAMVDYELADSELKPSSPVALTEGHVVGINPPRDHNIHKMLNVNNGITYTIHTYGDPGVACRSFDVRTGRCEENEMVFHNQL